MKTARLLVAAAASALFLSACGAGGNTDALCQEATKAFTDYTSKAGASAGDLDSLNTATADLAAKLKELSAKADSDLKPALANLATSFGSIKIDPKDPTAGMTDFSTKATEGAAALGKACTG